jgi:FkbM family methyltransferase
MNVLKALTTSEYLFRPQMIIHRFRRAWWPPREFETVTLPWGSPIRIKPGEVIGSNIWSYGVFDMTVTEAICRLLDPGETSLDIGANVGQMTNLMRLKAGRGGRVVSFEPHPELFAELKYNIETLPAPADSALVELHNLALSDAAGEASLDVGTAWSSNRGTGKVASAGAKGAAGLIAIQLAVLDQILDRETRVGVCKIDVEGHELQVLKGAAGLLAKRRFRDIIFEDYAAYPSPVHELLLDQGFTLFSLHRKLWRPRLTPASPQTTFNERKEGRDYLATLNPARATQRFKSAGWRSLR